MSFIPGEAASAITNLTTGTGSGIVSSVTFGTANLTSGLVAGSNVTLTPTSAFGGKGLRIDTTPGISGVTSVTAGTGITVTGTGANPVVNNDGVLTVATTGSGSGITIAGTAQNPQIANAGVLSLNSQTGPVTLASAGNSVTITTPVAGTINLEAAGGGGGTLTGITPGTGISVTNTNPAAPTVANTGVLSLTAGSNISVSASTGPVTIAATNIPRPMGFSIQSSRNLFPIAQNNFGNFGVNTLTTFGDLLAGTGAFVGVNTGTVIMDMTGYCLTTVTGQDGTYQVYLNVVGVAGSGLLVQTIQPSYPDGSTQDAGFNLGLLMFTMDEFRNAFGTGPGNAVIYIAILNNNVNSLFPAGNATNYIAWYYPSYPFP